ncbi:restriction endonuclease subunit S [Streptomyces sp. NPDC095614]|uniref:restriction endonuclease subunit S n=1 Tax=Streptomyces sp. NPDC095614 TaxID=3156692 RepID=UPI0033314288
MTTPLGRLAYINPPVPEFLADPEASITFMPLETIWADGKEDCSRRANAQDVAAAYTRFRNGDVLMPKITPTFEAGRVLATQIDTHLGAATTEVHVLRPRDGVDSRFLAYVCRSLPFLQEGASSLQGVGNLRRVPSDFIAKFPVTVTDSEAQQVVANYLDEQVAGLNLMVSEQRSLVTMLIERRGAVRTRLATLGLDADVSCRSTCLEWLREVPEHWDVVPLRSVARLESGHTPSRSRPELWTDAYIPWISLNDLSALATAEYIRKTTNLISDAGIAASSARLLPAGTVVLSRDATVGRTAIMEKPMATSQHFADFVCGQRLSPRYLRLLFSDAMQAYFDSLTNGSTIKTIGMGNIKSFRIPLPPRDEQDAIVAAAEAQTSRIDQLIKESQLLINLSLERRSALITDAVNGQIPMEEMRR